MQKALSTLISLFFLTHVFAQKTEVVVSFNSGLFSFSGKSAEERSFINYSNTTNSGYTNNPYGSKSGFCYGISADLKKVTKKKLLLGIELGYEMLRSKIALDAVNGSAATGQTFLNYSFINLHPYIGHRFSSGKVSFDITGGFDAAFCLNAMEKGNATISNGTKYATSLDRKTITTDIRPRIQLAANYHKAGIYLGYSLGLANYKKGYVGGVNECFGRLIRFGLTYQLK